MQPSSARAIRPSLSSWWILRQASLVRLSPHLHTPSASEMQMALSECGRLEGGGLDEIIRKTTRWWARILGRHSNISRPIEAVYQIKTAANLVLSSRGPVNAGKVAARTRRSILRRIIHMLRHIVRPSCVSHVCDQYGQMGDLYAYGVRRTQVLAGVAPGYECSRGSKWDVIALVT